MTALDRAGTADDLSAFIRDALEHLVAILGPDHPTVVAGRNALAALEEIPDEAVLVTEESLAAAIRRAYPSRRNTPSNATLTAAAILAALRSQD